jgi:hypothetical protein
VKAPSLEKARAAMAAYPSLLRVELELDEYRGLAGDELDGRAVVRVTAASVAQLEALLSIPGDFEIVVLIGRETAAWLLGAPATALARLVLRQPTHERLTESAACDVDLRALFARLDAAIPVEDVPACVTGRTPRPRPAVLDGAMTDAAGRLEIFRYTRRYVLDHYRTKSLRCRDCAHDADCAGLHVNYVRAHGYGVMQPVASAT